MNEGGRVFVFVCGLGYSWRMSVWMCGGWENFKVSARVRGFARELEGERKGFCVDECMDGWQKLWVDAKVSRNISF